MVLSWLGAYPRTGVPLTFDWGTPNWAYGNSRPGTGIPPPATGVPPSWDWGTPQEGIWDLSLGYHPGKDDGLVEVLWDGDGYLPGVNCEPPAYIVQWESNFITGVSLSVYRGYPISTP